MIIMFLSAQFSYVVQNHVMCSTCKSLLDSNGMKKIEQIRLRKKVTPFVSKKASEVIYLRHIK